MGIGDGLPFGEGAWQGINYSMFVTFSLVAVRCGSVQSCSSCCLMSDAMRTHDACLKLLRLLPMTLPLTLLFCVAVLAGGVDGAAA